MSSNQIRITWSLDVEEWAVFSIFIYDEESNYVDSWLFLEDQPEGQTYAYLSPGYYYLDISTYECAWTIKIESMTP